MYQNLVWYATLKKSYDEKMSYKKKWESPVMNLVGGSPRSTE